MQDNFITTIKKKKKYNKFFVCEIHVRLPLSG